MWKDKVKKIGSIWREVVDIRAYSRDGQIVALEDADGLKPVDADSVARKELTNTELINYYSLSIRARDKANPRKVYETRLAGWQLRKVITCEPYPTRRAVAMNHDKYSVLLAYLCKCGIACRSRNGYRWTSDYVRMAARAEWLIEHLKRKGEMRNYIEGKWHIL